MVTHDRYGLGRIILVEGDTAVVVDFAPRKVRITTPFARMTKLLPGLPVQAPRSHPATLPGLFRRAVT